MKDWERIRKERTDITDYVIHWVRPKYSEEYVKPLATLLAIIKCGYLTLIRGFSKFFEKNRCVEG